MVRRIFSVLAVAALLAAPAVPAAKAKRQSLYTDLTGKDCANPGEGDLRCPGYGGWKLDIADSGNIIYLRIYRAAAPDVVLEIQGRGMGEKAEWRGTGAGKRFRPDALIVRLRPVEPDEQMSSILHIVKLNPAGACFSGIVDAKANRSANVLARNAADELSDVCDPYPQVYGKQTEATVQFGS